MTMSQWLGIGLAVLLAAFVGFAFRQGEKVKRPRSDARFETDPTNLTGDPGSHT